MENLSLFAQKVLNHLQPDLEKQKELVEAGPLFAVCTKPCMSEMAERVAQAQAAGEKVLVAGDYDCDGVCATAIMVESLQSLGLDCAFYIPDRIQEGYGLSAHTVERAAQAGFSLIVTVDNGVRAHSALAKARELGIDVIVTDHHSYDEKPDCVCLVHPKVMEKPFEELCGAGVAYECSRYLKTDTPRQQMYAALASIADCMPVYGQTRSIIRSGLAWLNETRDLHITSLCEDEVYNETTASFQIIPRINSIGRMSDLAKINSLPRFLLSTDPGNIASYASQMTQINEIRKEKTALTSAKAMALITPYHNIVMAADESFHEGLIGLAAGQMCSKLKKPAIVCSKTETGYKGSMRSPKGFDCMEFLGRFDSFSACGGHSQAAGFSVDEKDWPAFEKFVASEARKPLHLDEVIDTMSIDAQDITVENIESLDALRPFGTGFELPRFRLEGPAIKSTFDLKSGRHRKFILENGVQAMHFHQSSADAAASPSSVASMSGSLSINVWQGRKSPVFIIDEIEYYENLA